MNSHTKLTASLFLIKRAANYLGMGGAAKPLGLAPASQAIKDLVSRYSGATTTNPNYPNARARHQETIAAGKPPVTAASPAAPGFRVTTPSGAFAQNFGYGDAPAASPAANTDLNATFKKYMGTAFDPNSKLDQSKMKYLQGLSDEGVTMNAANIYDKGQGYGQF